MDGTVLDDKKQLGQKTIEAINAALDNGVEVVFCSGRAHSEMNEFFDYIPNMHYLVCESGAFVYDLKERKIISQKVISKEMLLKILELSDNDSQMILAFNDGIVCMRDDERLNTLFCDKFSIVEHLMKCWHQQCREPLLQYLAENDKRVEKVNIYHLTEEEKIKTLKKLQDSHLELVFSEMNSIEISPVGVSKAQGLSELCDNLGVSMNEVVMVGDADNDLEALKAVGLPVAMGNANDNVKAVSKIVVADNNHDGCAEAIYKVMEINAKAE